MPDVKISGLPVSPAVTSGSLIPAVTTSTTHQTTVLAATQAALTSLNINTGNSAIGVGGAVQNPINRIRATGTVTGATNGNTILGDPIFAADVTTDAKVFNAAPTTAAAAFTLTRLIGFRSASNPKGTNSVITSHMGFLADSSLVQATNNYGFYGDVPATTATCWNLYMAGSAPNYFNGRVGIGTSIPGSHLEVVPGTASTQGINCLLNGAATTVCYSIMAQAAGPAASNTGLYVNVLSATSTNYGVRIINPPAGANNWAIYSDSAAQSHFVGNIGIGTGITVPTSPLDVGGNSIRIRTSSSPTSAATAGNAGEIRWDSGFLYVCTASGAAGVATWKRVALTAI